MPSRMSILAFVNALLHEVREPALQVAVGGDLLDERVGALGQHRGRFDLDVVIEVDAQLLDEARRMRWKKVSIVSTVKRE